MARSGRGEVSEVGQDAIGCPINPRWRTMRSSGRLWQPARGLYRDQTVTSLAIGKGDTHSGLRRGLQRQHLEEVDSFWHHLGMTLLRLCGYDTQAYLTKRTSKDL